DARDFLVPEEPIDGLVLAGDAVVEAASATERHLASHGPSPGTRNEKGPGNFPGPFDQAEGAGFEPAVEFKPHAALAKRCYRPLSHLSERVAARSAFSHG